MSFMQLARERYSVRKFKPDPVPREKLEQILECGRLAPTARNRQPQRILVVESPEALALLRPCTPCHFDAPVVLIVCYDSAASAKREDEGVDFGIQDACIVATHMMLETAALGLGATWVGMFSPAQIREVFALPDHIQPVCLMPLGIPADDTAPGSGHTSFLPANQTIFWNKL